MLGQSLANDHLAFFCKHHSNILETMMCDFLWFRPADINPKRLALQCHRGPASRLVYD